MDNLLTMSQEKPIKLYLDYISQPSRTVLAFCKFNNIPYEPIEIRVLKSQNTSPTFTKVSPLQKVPTIDDDGYTLSESHAIMKYLCSTRKVQDNWYPKDDPKKRGKIDMYLDWHHSNTRRCAMFIVSQTYPHMEFVKRMKPDTETERKAVDRTLKTIENAFLKDSEFLCGDKMTLADLSACCEIMQLKIINFDFTPYPLVTKWLERCMDNQVMKDVHSVLFKVIEYTRKPKL